ncbi:unnamed protein product, partial [Mesorhabditis belari]|uniref:Uncharacterized protein n=1 Tax=Mesorhabditis belari TaxID=2138241 RepID=A0AAF3FD59_9BILA
MATGFVDVQESHPTILPEEYQHYAIHPRFRRQFFNSLNDMNDIGMSSFSGMSNSMIGSNIGGNMGSGFFPSSFESNSNKNSWGAFSSNQNGGFNTKSQTRLSL